MLIQKIGNHHLNVAYVSCTPADGDMVLPMDKADILFNPETKQPYTYAEIKEEDFMQGENVVYVFAIDEARVFTAIKVPAEFSEKAMHVYVRDLGKDRPELQLAGATVMHLLTWYKTHQYCGCCGGKNHHDMVERAMKCEKCNHLTFPVICPAIIIAVVDKENDRILLTRSARRKNSIFSLIAGFTEIGETLEQTAAREAMEETGVKVKNIRPYINQPWGFSSSLMCGFFAELDGSDELHIQEDEIAEAKWFKRDEMPINDSPIDITHHMMEMWRQGLVEI